MKKIMLLFLFAGIGITFSMASFSQSISLKDIEKKCFKKYEDLNKAIQCVKDNSEDSHPINDYRNCYTMYYSTDPDKAIECTLKYRDDFRKIRNQFSKATNYLKGFKQFEEGKKYRYSCRSIALLNTTSALGGYPSGVISGQVKFSLEEYQKRIGVNINITKLSEDEILVEDGELVNNRRLADPGSYFKKEENTFLIENRAMQLAYRAVSKDRVIVENSTVGRFANKEVYAPIKAKSSFDSVDRAVVQYVQCDRIH